MCTLRQLFYELCLHVQNKKYELGLKWAISELLSKGIEPRVLDIGSGTGLLSMMAARNGAQNITAIEVCV